MKNTSRLVFIDEPDFACYLDESVPCFVFEYRGYVDGEDFRRFHTEAAMHYTKLRQSYNPLYLLTNGKQVTATDPENISWFNTHMVPKYLAFGKQRTALIMPDDVFGKLAIQEYMEETAKNPVVINGVDTRQRLFNAIEEAIEWLKSQY